MKSVLQPEKDVHPAYIIFVHPQARNTGFFQKGEARLGETIDTQPWPAFSGQLFKDYHNLIINCLR